MLEKVRFVAVLVAAVGLVGAPAAQASDAGLRKVIQKQEKKLVAASEKLSKASEAIETPADFPAVADATSDLRDAGKAFKKALTPVSGSSADGKKAKTKMLAALKEMDAGLLELQKVFEQGDDATKADFEASEKKFEKRLDKASKLEDQAHALLGLESDD